MNLIFIYGPPAVGKLTVGSLVAELTGYRLFHNHLTIPAVNAIFDQKTPARSRLLKKLRIDTIAAAAEAGINMIFTAAYSGGPEDEAFIQQITDIVLATPNGRMMYVQLYAPEDVLLDRVGNESRKPPELQKINDPARYRQRLATRDITVSVVYKDVLRLDTVALSPQQAAQEVVRHFGL